MKRDQESRFGIRIGSLVIAVVCGLLLINLAGCGGSGSSPPGDAVKTAGDFGVFMDENPHANLAFADYPGNCLGCHAEQAAEMFNSVHYQWIGATPDMVNNGGEPQGKLTNAVNSYCINIEGNWGVCGACHVGRGLRPDDAEANFENIDCLMCHNASYAVQRVRLGDGTLGVLEPDDQMVRDIHHPTRANCLACHAKAGGGDGVKRGDISMATLTNSDPNFDVHMNTQGPDLACSECHVFEKHKVLGKGSDLRPTDDPARGAEVSCLTCHPDKEGRNGHDSSNINSHVARVACQTCHIPTYAKVATEIHRDWRTHHDGSPADETAHPGHPYTEKAANLMPTYRFWNRTSDNALLGDDASRTYDAGRDTWPTSIPMGDVTDGRIFPFKYKTAMQPKTVADNRLIALDTYEYLKVSGDITAAIEQGLTAMGYPAHEPYEWILTDTHQLINHGINPASHALQCNDCHGSIDRMDLQGEMGYQLKAERTTVCTQCHGNEGQKGFRAIHNIHVDDEKYDCNRCHLFSRPERGLGDSHDEEDDDDD